MANLEKHRCIARLQKKYALANRAGKTKILDGVCLTFACHRKDAIRLLNQVPAVPETTRKIGLLELAFLSLMSLAVLFFNP